MSFLNFPQTSSPTFLIVDFSSLNEKYFVVVAFHKKILEVNFRSVTDFFQVKDFTMNYIFQKETIISALKLIIKRERHKYLCKLVTEKKKVVTNKKNSFRSWVRLNYATINHDPPRSTPIHSHPPPTKIYPSPSTTTQHQPKYIHYHPPPSTTSQNISTTTHHHPPPAKIYPSPPTNSQNISTTTYHFPKNGPPPRKSQNIFIYCITYSYILFVSK